MQEVTMNKTKRLREKKGLRQIDLAKKANVSLTWIWALENGFEDRISVQVKSRIARALECDPTLLFGNK